MEPRDNEKPLPAQPDPVRNNKVRRADPGSFDSNYFDIIRSAEDVKSFDEEWNALISTFEATYSRFINLPAPAAAPRNPAPSILLSNIDTTDIVRLSDPRFVFSSEPIDALLDPYRLDQLLTEITAIAERCIVERRDQRDLASRAANIAFELIDFLRRDRIYREQVANGLLSLSYIEAQRTWDGAVIQADGVNERAESQRKALDDWFSDRALATASDAAQRSAWAAGRNAYSNPDPGAPAEHAWGAEPKKTVSEQMRIAAAVMADRASALEKATRVNELAALQQMANRTITENVVLRERAQLAIVNIASEQAKHRANVEIVKAKIAAACDAGGALNYAEQEASVRLTLENDFRNLAARIPVLHAGLQKILGVAIEVPDPLFTMFPTNIRGPLGKAADRRFADPLEAAVAWARQAVSLLLAQRQKDQRLSVTVSMAKLLGADWPKFKTGQVVTFDLAASDFGHRQMLRISALSAETVGQISAAVWQIDLTLPDKSVIEGSSLDRAARDIDQSPAAKVFLSGVRDASAYAPATAVADPVINRSPLGKWSIAQHFQGVGAPILDDLRLTIAVQTMGE